MNRDSPGGHVSLSVRAVANRAALYPRPKGRGFSTYLQDNENSSIMSASELFEAEKFTGEVLEAPPHSQGDRNFHTVKVAVKGLPQDSLECQVGVGLQGDVTLPTEGSFVVVTLVNNNRPIITQVLYDPIEDLQYLPEYETGERRWGHRFSETYMQLTPEGDYAWKTPDVEFYTDRSQKEVIADDTSGDEPKGVVTEDTKAGDINVLGKKPHFVVDASETTLKTN